MKNKPSAHLLIQLIVLMSAIAGYLAVYAGARLRGYAPSVLMMVRDLSLVALLIIGFVVLVKVLRFRGNLTLYTGVVLLFAVGLIAQFRLFSDPEYTSRGNERAAARLAKAQAIRARAIEQGYDETKLRVVFGTAKPVELSPKNGLVEPHFTLGDLLTSARTYTLMLALMSLWLALVLIRRESFLLWMQRHSILIALLTLVPLMFIILFFTSGGKFVGGMTPWEPAKVLFLISLAGVLVDSYRALGKPRWGLPSLRFFLPLVVTATFALVPFFVLEDFGQLLVFGIVYTLLYVIAVKRPGQVVFGMALLVAVLSLVLAVGGMPRRVQYRYYLWKQTWQPPPENAEWWAPMLQRIRAAYGSSGTKVSNEEAWFDQGSQLMQALFGINHGGVIGFGLGLGLPETVPVSESDFIYAAIAEETGMVGGFAVVLGTLLIGWFGWREAVRAHDMFTKLLAAGVTAFLVAQAFVNIAGVLKLSPMTGITLPFVSHGGWSLLTSFTMIGILMGISHRNAIELDKTIKQ